jgi:hypothetical protein
MDDRRSGGAQMNIIEMAQECQLIGMRPHLDGIYQEALKKFAALVAAHERDAIMKSIEELRPVEDNPLLQTKPAAFWIENFRQIVYTRGTT